MNMDESYGYYPCFSAPTKASIVILQTLDPEINPIKGIRHPITELNNIIIKIWNEITTNIFAQILEPFCPTACLNKVRLIRFPILCLN